MISIKGMLAHSTLKKKKVKRQIKMPIEKKIANAYLHLPSFAPLFFSFGFFFFLRFYFYLHSSLTRICHQARERHNRHRRVCTPAL